MLTTSLVLLVSVTFSTSFLVPAYGPASQLKAKTMMEMFFAEAFPIGFQPQMSGWRPIDRYKEECFQKRFCLCYETTATVESPEEYHPCRKDAYVCYTTTASQKRFAWDPIKNWPDDFFINRNYTVLASTTSGERSLIYDHGDTYKWDPIYLDDKGGWITNGYNHADIDLFANRPFVGETIELLPLKTYIRYRKDSNKPERAFNARVFSDCKNITTFRMTNAISGLIYGQPNGKF
uniref:Secreted protein n=1 Tax=Steinernema glaseri TaxID=37863 RepID=A0A1I8A126_9BILA